MNFLIVGLGSAGQRHARVLRKFYPKSKIFAYRGNHYMGLIDKNLQNIDPNIDPNIYYCLTELKSLEKFSQPIDLAIIATPADTHSIYAEKVWDYSQRILVEKPISNCKVESRALYEKAITDHKIIFIGYQHNFNPILKKVKSIFSTYEQWKTLSCEFHESLLKMNDFRDMRKHHMANPKKGNALLALSHELDFVYQLFPDSWNVIQSKLYSSGSLNEALDVYELVGLYNHHQTQIEFSVSLNFGNVNKSRKGFLIGQNISLSWDLVEKTLNLGSRIETFNYTADDLILKEINYVLSKQEFDQELKISLKRALKIIELM
jgi:predicted dehydrogenase